MLGFDVTGIIISVKCLDRTGFSHQISKVSRPARSVKDVSIPQSWMWRACCGHFIMRPMPPCYVNDRIYLQRMLGRFEPWIRFWHGWVRRGVPEAYLGIAGELPSGDLDLSGIPSAAGCAPS